MPTSTLGSDIVSAISGLSLADKLDHPTIWSVIGDEIDLADQWAKSGNDIYNKNSGNVGVGTSTPTAKLDVTDYVRVTGPTSSPPTSGAGVEITYENSQTRGHIQAYDRTLAGYTALYIDGHHLYLNHWAGANATVYSQQNFIMAKAHFFQGSTTITTGTYGAQSVAQISIIQADCSGGNVTINGFAGGYAGQIIRIWKSGVANNLILNHWNAGGTQKLIMRNAANVTLNNFGMATFYCDGSNWHSDY